MCGICGIAGQLNNKQIYRDIISKMLESIYHRGPDDEGIFMDKEIILGIRRLSIIDLENGHQPMTNEDGTVWTVFNGEIYNFLDLRESLKKKGHIFKTHSDTEVILHLYEEKDLELVNMLQGMFAFAIWDKKKSKIILARDRFGIKPLYYTVINDILVFASELKSILAFPEVKKEINPLALDNYLSLEYIPSPQSIFKNVYKLPPAHILTFKDQAINLTKYWKLEKQDSIVAKNELEAKERLLGLLKQSIKKHFISDVPIGIYLSGGIDSSSIVAISKELFPYPVKTFSIDFKEDSFDESKYSKEIASRFNTEHEHRLFDSADMIKALPQIVKMLDEPFADASIFPTYLLSKFSKDYIKVALSGDGGDEIFAGYPTYLAHNFVKYYKFIPYFIRRKIIEKLVKKIPVSHRNFSLDFILKKFISGAEIDDFFCRHIVWMGAFDESEKKYLCRGGLIDNRENEMYPSGLNLKKEADLLTMIQKLDIDTYLEGDILVKTDRASMMNSQEVRIPYLDHELVEFVFNLPASWRIKNFTTKYIFKETMNGRLPKNIINRKKKGFGVPIAFWIKNQLKDLVLDTLNKDQINRQGLFNYDYIKEILDQHLKGKADNRKKIWNIFMFELWYREYIGQ